MQIARALRRVFTEADRGTLADRLMVWEGPPPGDVAKHPDVLRALAEIAEADTLVIDSLKDAAVGLTEDETAAAYNRARQTALAAGVQVLELHHMVKRGANGSKPTELADVYGSAWLTAGAGSVVLLWGAAGDPIVELRHLKQPSAEVGPWRLVHDHEAGTTELFHGADLVTLAASTGRAGVTAQAAARSLFETEKPDRNEVEKARRKLEKLVREGLLEVVEQAPESPWDELSEGHRGGRPTRRYRVAAGASEGVHGAITRNHATPSGESNHDPITAITDTPDSRSGSNHASNHANHAPGAITHRPPSREGAVCAPASDEAPEDTPPVRRFELETELCRGCQEPKPVTILRALGGRCGSCAVSAGAVDGATGEIR